MTYHDDEQEKIEATGAKPVDLQPTIIERLAVETIDQFKSLPKGKRRDELTVTFWCGACAGLKVSNSPDAAWVARVTVLLIGTRGYSEAEAIVARMQRATEQTP